MLECRSQAKITTIQTKLNQTRLYIVLEVAVAALTVKLEKQYVVSSRCEMHYRCGSSACGG